MTKFESYQYRFSHLALSRDAAGVLEARLHTDNGSFEMRPGGSVNPQAELADAFSLIAADPENRVVLLRGTGSSFSGPRKTRDAVRLLMNFVEIDAPIISCINGPALRHAELPLLADIVLADTNAVIQDTGHFTNNTVPGDGINVVLPMVVGQNRGRYHLLTGKPITAEVLHSTGAVAEILKPDQLVERGRQLAAELAKVNPLVTRYTRLVLRRAIRKELQDALEHSIALEALAAVDETSRRKQEAR
jgi:enoyl-CoA hydratase/carnithine racemase